MEQKKTAGKSFKVFLRAAKSELHNLDTIIIKEKNKTKDTTV